MCLSYSPSLGREWTPGATGSTTGGNGKDVSIQPFDLPRTRPSGDRFAARRQAGASAAIGGMRGGGGATGARPSLFRTAGAVIVQRSEVSLRDQRPALCLQGDRGEHQS